MLVAMKSHKINTGKIEVDCAYNLNEMWKLSKSLLL